MTWFEIGGTSLTDQDVGATEEKRNLVRDVRVLQAVCQDLPHL